MLEAAENASPVEALEAVTRELGAALRARAVSFLIADFSGRGLVRLAHITRDPGYAAEDTPIYERRRHADESAEGVPFDGGLAEQAMRTQTVQVLAPAAPSDEDRRAAVWTVLAPVTERGEVLGLLEMKLPAEPGADVLAEVAATAHVLAFVVIANRRHTDLFEWAQRSTAFTLAAEIQRRLLPAAMTCEAGAFTLSAWLEPADHVGGDSFDYSVGRDMLHVSMTDAMGHGIASALTATLCLGSLRNTRRKGATLLEQAAAANAALIEQAADGVEAFATGLLCSLDLLTGTLALVNAGHVLPFLARAGEVTRLELPADLPFGLFADTTYRCTELALEPGDRLVLVTDGMLERNAATLDLVAAIFDTSALHPRETTRCLADSVLAVAGAELVDDATLLVLDWHGGHGDRAGGGRATASGADFRRGANSTGGATKSVR